MRKLFLSTLFIAAACALATAQSQGDIPNQGRAPTQPNGMGKLDARVFDEAGSPVRGVYLKLESERTDGYFCESWNSTDERGVAVLPPIHMGRLRLVVKAKGYENQKLVIDANTLNDPVRITLVKKK